MNEQNNFNFQNNSNNNLNNSPMHPVKNRFFNQELFNDTVLDNVGSPTTEQANNYGMNNSSFVNADKKNIMSNSQSENGVFIGENDSNKKNHFSSIFSQELLENVNADLYPPETLNDTDFNSNNGEPDTLFGYTETEVLDTIDTLDDLPGDNVEVLDNVLIENNNINSNNTLSSNNNTPVGVVGAAAPIFQQNIAPNTDNQSMINNEILSQQPLSLNALGASPVNQQDIPDVQDNSKYFPSPDGIIQKEKQALLEKNYVAPVTKVESLLEEDVVIIDETALLKAYVGPKYNKYFRSNFSAFALIFGSFAFFCRNLYLIGLILYIFQVIVLFIFRDIPYIILAILIILSFIMSMIINPLYLGKAKKATVSIRKKHPKVSQGDLNNLCAKKGKNNIFIALLLQIVLIIVTVFGAIKILGTDYFVDIFENVKNKVLKVENKEIVFDGTIKYNDLDIEDYFNIIVPDLYKEGDNMNFSYFYVTEGEGKNNSCSFNFGGVDGFNSAQQLLEKMAIYYEVDTDVDVVNYNDLEWYLLYVNTDEGKIYYRATEIDGEIILFEFLSGADTPTGVCDSQIVILLDTIEKK